MTGKYIILILFASLLYIYSFILFIVLKNGFGLVICNVGILIFLLKFRFNLRSLDEQEQSSNSKIVKFIPVCFAIFSLVTASLLISKLDKDNLFFQHLINLLNIFILCICMPQYFINRNENFKLYVSVYHHQPPPVLPWQLPSNFDSNSVKLLYVKSNEEGVVGETWRDPCLE